MYISANIWCWKG